MTAIVKVADAAERDPFVDAGPGFNHEAAQMVYGAIMKCADDDEASVLATMYLGKMLAHEMVIHGNDIEKALRAGTRARLVEIGKSLVNQAVEATRNGEDPSSAIAGIEELDRIAKALPGDDQDLPRPRHQSMAYHVLTAQESMARAMQAKQQKRDLLSGRFVQESKKITHLSSEAPLHTKDAALLGIPDPGHMIPRPMRAAFQRGYLEVQNLLDEYSQLKPEEGVLHLHYDKGAPDHFTLGEVREQGGNGAKLGVRSFTPGQNGQPGTLLAGLDPKRKLLQADLSVLPSEDLSGPGVRRHIGDITAERHLLNPETWNVENTGSLGDALTRSASEQEQYQPGVRAMRRTGALAGAINATLGPLAPPKLKLALATAEHAGKMGPEASRVLGPVGDRAAYRYRGTERKTPDSRLVNARNSIVMNPAFRGAEKREALIGGIEDDQANWHPLGVLSYFRSLVPRADLNTLQRKSGAIPPSQGVIFDRKGNIAVQAVGYGDDHYLPFNLKNLAKLRGGEYIRTRTFGGPTTEDVYTGLMAGAKATTIVSHNGVYTLEFDDDLKGGRRFNDKAARMVTRYGQLLDAVQSEQVRTGAIHPSKMRELEQRAADRYDPVTESERFEGELETLVAREKKNPTFSAEQRQQATTDFFTGLAEKRMTADGHVMSAPQMVDDWANQEAARRVHPDAPASDRPRWVRDYKAQIMSQIGDDPEKLADAMGVRRQFDASLKRAEEDYRGTLTPLRLNSQGYNLALTALQEQFPYYIKRIQFHPWDDANAVNGFDTGYVAPRHNRPHAVLAGYFNEKVLGHGKVRADSIRNQNYMVRQGKLDHVERKVTTPAGAKAATGTVTAVDPEAAKVLRVEALNRVIDELRQQENFSPHARTPTGGVPLANQPVRNMIEDMKTHKDFTALHWFLDTDRDKIAADISASYEKVERQMRDALRQADALDLFDINPAVRRNFSSGGQVEPLKVLGDKAADFLDQPRGTEYDIPGDIFTEGSRHTAEQIGRAYESDSAVQALVKTGELPASPADGAQFEQQAKDLRRAIKDQRVKVATFNAKRAAGQEPPNPGIAEHEVHRRAEGLLRAEQLQRRYSEAFKREALISAPSGITPSEIIEQHIHFPDAETYFETQRGLTGGNGTING